MIQVKITTGFTRLRDEELDSRAQAIVAAMTGNTNFATPSPTLQVISAALKAFQDAAAEAAKGNRSVTALRDALRTDLIHKLNDLSLYVQLNCKNDLSILLSSGYKARKTSEPSTPIQMPQGLKVQATDVKGSVKVFVNKVENVVTYIFEYRPRAAPDAAWTSLFGTTRALTISGLQSGAEYMFRVGAVGTGPTVKYSTEVASFVL
ncbi:fibronectin type III domain-containing protein [Chryseolinea lacunae]|uniref:Fibronectin type III domain-containing protein n=1 Tax=Chryseolinea lacunae TaxID=2801331 RepID=A0ABS1KNG4_9BACT|nr:fibronectin type III domain-containing protein [Chryseolinea lacunae]MBL0740994.1 fibronectin type III domain-containing protein [Chryseolinea lacunae]